MWLEILAYLQLNHICVVVVFNMTSLQAFDDFQSILRVIKDMVGCINYLQHSVCSLRSRAQIYPTVMEKVAEEGQSFTLVCAAWIKR